MSESIRATHANLTRLSKIMSDCASTFIANARGVGKLERRAVAHIPRDDVDEFRDLCREKLGPVLRELDAWLEARAEDDGVRCGVAMFGFDDESE